MTVNPAAASVGESSAQPAAGDRLTVRELLEAALIQSANDAADALAYYVGHGSQTRFVAMMNARARQLGLKDTHFVRPDGLDAPGHVSSAHDVTLLARILMHRPLVRQIVRERGATISGGRSLHTWNDLLSTYPGCSGSRPATPRPPGGPRWPLRGGAASRSTRRCSAAPTARPATPTSPGCSTGASRATGRPRSSCAAAPSPRRSSRTAASRWRSSQRARSRLRCGSACRSSAAGRRATWSSCPCPRGQTLGQVQLYQRGHLIGRRPARGEPLRSAARASSAARAGTRRVPCTT